MKKFKYLNLINGKEMEVARETKPFRICDERLKELKAKRNMGDSVKFKRFKK